MLPIALTYWPFLETFLENNIQKILPEKLSKIDIYKIRANLISGFHALSIIIFGCIYLVTQSNNLFYFIFFFSIVYFIYDSYSVWFNKIKEYYPYFIHHGASIYFLQCLLNYDGDVKSKMILGYVFLEISNLPSYYIYYYLKTNKNKTEEYYKKLLNLKLGQLGLYGIMRLVIFGYLMTKCYKDIIHQPVLTLCIISLYFMGIYWSYQLSMGYIKTQKDYMNIIQT
jgi:hypothetical protein